MSVGGGRLLERLEGIVVADYFFYKNYLCLLLYYLAQSRACCNLTLVKENVWENVSNIVYWVYSIPSLHLLLEYLVEYKHGLSCCGLGFTVSYPHPLSKHQVLSKRLLERNTRVESCHCIENGTLYQEYNILTPQTVDMVLKS
jgi:hypothetical protein